MIRSRTLIWWALTLALAVPLSHSVTAAGDAPAAPALTTRPATDDRLGRLHDTLAAEFLFDGDATDTSDSKLEADVIGAELAADRFGRPGKAYHFDGKASWIEINPPPRLLPDALTISVWAKYEPNAFRAWNNPILCQDNGMDQKDTWGRFLQISNNGRRITWHRFGDASGDPTAKQDVQPGRWYHVVATFDGTMHRLYIDGELQGTAPGTLRVSNTEPLFIGRKNVDDAPDFFFLGSIDDLRIYRKALNADEIAALYHENGWPAK